MTTKDEHEQVREVWPLRSAPLAEDRVPRRVLLAPWGHIESTNGNFVLDDESAALAVAAFEEHGTDLPIDYEHQTLGGSYAAPDGQAPAAGWIKAMIAEPGSGLWAEIEWTEQAIQRLERKEYRYLSPVAIVRKVDRKLVAIHSAALTNKPAIVGMRPIVNRTEPDADLAKAGSNAADSPFEVLRTELCLPPNTAAEEVLAAAGKRIGTLQREARERHVERRIAEAVSAGKLVEAQRAWAEELVTREEAMFDEWLRTAPTIVTPGATSPPTTGQAPERSRHAAAARARAEYRSDPLLSRLTSEEAFVADALKTVPA